MNAIVTWKHPGFKGWLRDDAILPSLCGMENFDIKDFWKIGCSGHFLGPIWHRDSEEGVNRRNARTNSFL
jgi:hypothetical protein